KELALLASLFAIEISESSSIDQQNVLGNFLATVGATLLTIAAQGQNLSSNSNGNDNNCSP
ncbi:MAG: hypothetical protein RR645_01340, partial [Clostridium sp.]